MDNERVILHSDMNSFYASVEMMLNPEFKGKPVAVCGSTEERHGIVLAKSDLAKKAGVKTGIQKPRRLPGPACERWRKPPANSKTMSPVSSRNGSISSSSPVPRWAALVRRPLFWTRRVIYGSPSSRPSTTMSMLAHGKRSPMTLRGFAAWMFPSPC